MRPPSGECASASAMCTRPRDVAGNGGAAAIIGAPPALPLLPVLLPRRPVLSRLVLAVMSAIARGSGEGVVSAAAAASAADVHEQGLPLTDPCVWELFPSGAWIA